MDYEKLLESAYEKMPKDAHKSERFEVPKVLGHIQGNRTIISNFHQIAGALGRKPEHVMKHVLKELAAPGELSKTALIIGTKISASRINEKLQHYVNSFIICRECKRPDTKIEKAEGLTFIKCSACGARHVVR
ncbi:translation initiation factor IF-2 subunit beta [Candidatus Woesearchaeota archaeon]|nr:translation initiation factor IF-2 subunit beta [Candidatus Woesearchaeota archaeon]